MEKHSFRSVPARLALLALAMLGAALLSLCLGAAAVSPREILSVLSGGGKGTTAASILCLLYTSPSPRDGLLSRMPSSA